MRHASNMSEISAEMLLNFLHPEEIDQWVVKDKGTFYRNYARTNTSLTRTDFDETKNKDVAFPSYMWAMPIPKSERDANPNVAQNPGY